MATPWANLGWALLIFAGACAVAALLGLGARKISQHQAKTDQEDAEYLDSKGGLL